MKTKEILKINDIINVFTKTNLTETYDHLIPFNSLKNIDLSITNESEREL